MPIYIVAFLEIFNYNEQSSNFLIFGFNIIVKLRPDLFGGVAIVVWPNISFQSVPYQKHHDITLPLLTISRFLPYTFPRQLASIFGNRTKRCFGSGFSARSQTLGDIINSRKGCALAELLSDTEFQIINNGKPTYYHLINNTWIHFSALDT